MTERQHGRMQGLAPEALQRRDWGGVAAFATVQRIADDRTSQVGQMDPDLVRAPGVELGPEQADDWSQRRTEALLDPVLGHGRPSPALADGHALAVDRMAANRGIDHP